jgi:hypothetical protein
VPEVGMVERGQHLALALEARESFRIAGHSLLHKLDGHLAIEPVSLAR